MRPSAGEKNRPQLLTRKAAEKRISKGSAGRNFFSRAIFARSFALPSKLLSAAQPFKFFFASLRLCVRIIFTQRSKDAKEAKGEQRAVFKCTLNSWSGWLRAGVPCPASGRACASSLRASRRRRR